MWHISCFLQFWRILASIHFCNSLMDGAMDVFAELWPALPNGPKACVNIYVVLALGEHGAKQFLSTWGLTKFKLFARVAVLVKSRLIIAREVYIQYQVQAVLCDKILKSGP